MWSIPVSTNRLWNVSPPLNVKEWLKKFPKPNMIVLNTEYGHMTHKIFTNRHLKPRKTAPNGAFVEWKSTFVNMTWISDILELWNMEMIISFKRSEYFILMIPFQFKYLIRFIGLPKTLFQKFSQISRTQTWWNVEDEDRPVRASQIWIDRRNYFPNFQ